MTTHDHYTAFKSAHRMSLRIAKTHISHSNGNGATDTLQEIGHLPDKLPLRMRIREYLKKGWEPIRVNKQVDSITMPKWIASAILVTVLGFGVTSWMRSSDQRDLLIEMRTELRLAKEAKAAEDSRRDQAAADMQAWREVMNGNLKEIKGMLSQQQIDALERLRKSSNGN